MNSNGSVRSPSRPPCGWRVTVRSAEWSCAATPKSSTSAARPASSAVRFAGRWWRVTVAVCSPAVSGPRCGATPIHIVNSGAPPPKKVVSAYSLLFPWSAKRGGGASNRGKRETYTTQAPPPHAPPQPRGAGCPPPRPPVAWWAWSSVRDEVGRAIAGEHRDDAAAGELRHAPTRRLAGAADVREQHRVRRGEQARVHLGLALEHVDARRRRSCRPRARSPGPPRRRPDRARCSRAPRCASSTRAGARR